MATAQEIKKIKNRAAEGLSVNQIKEKIGLPKSTVYYHFKKEVGQKQKENALLIPDDDEFQGELCGIFAGDGNFYKEDDGHYKIRFFLNLDESYWEILSDYLEIKLGKKANVYCFEEHTRATISYNSKDLYEFLKSKLEWDENKGLTVMMKKEETFSREFKIGFIRGLIDTDGYREKNFRRYIYGTISKELRNDFSRILSDLKISHTNYQEEAEKEKWNTMYKIRISGDSAEKIGKEVKFRNPKKDFNTI